MFKKLLVTPLLQIILLTALILAGMLSSSGPWESLENKNYDFWAHFFRSPGNQPVEIIAIDEKSVRQIGDWPWPRARIAEMVRLLSAQGADAQGICLLFTHPELNPGLLEIRNLKDQIADHKWRGGKSTTRILENWLNKAEDRLDQDADLIAAIRRARNAVLPIRFTKEGSADAGSERLSGILIINSLNAQVASPDAAETPSSIAKALGNGQPAPEIGQGVLETFDDLATKAGALGHLNIQEDPDGVVRRMPLLIDYKGRLFPALALQLAIKHIDAQLKDLAIEEDFLGQSLLKVRHLQISTDDAYQMLLNHDRKWLNERRHSFVDVVNDTIDLSIFKGKIVLIGVTGEEMAQSYRVGLHDRATTVEIAADALAGILSTVRLSRPSWGQGLEIVALLYFAFFLIFVIPRVSAKIGAAILAIFVATWYAMVVGLLLGYGYQVNLFGPVFLAGLGFMAIQFTIYSGKRRQEKLEANKTLGLTYQGQGLLDMAYERLILCPAEDASVKNLLYNLALDFERKRMFNKALAIYKHIRINGAFKDIDKRCDRLKLLDSTMALTVPGARPETSLIIDDDASANPTFGRYELLKELGRGSMGTVYLGRDPKINREVAIKTLEYAQVAQSELADVKTRFFREAEAAGKLSHPNIVSIYDVGEEHDMAYIAMELLAGEELTNYCKHENLLPLTRTITIISEVAVALDYAHRQGVIHRDIKPANIMILEDGRVKVTDFGIAQVIDASQTSTGVILGTPNYMSPEQVTGETIDGRSDLFSLGIVFYELLAGVKPFKGDTITAIMYAISHNTHTPLLECTSDVPPCCDKIVNTLLAKKKTKRFSSAAQLTKALEDCLAALQ